MGTGRGSLNWETHFETPSGQRLLVTSTGSMLRVWAETATAEARRMSVVFILEPFLIQPKQLLKVDCRNILEVRNSVLIPE
jgi:hypothetical protein